MENAKTVTLFKNASPRVAVFTKEGVPLYFIDGMYYTTIKKHEDFLKECAENGECGVYIDKDSPTIEATKPLEEVYRAAANKQTLNVAARSYPGDYTQPSLQASVGNTTHIAGPAGQPLTIKVPGNLDKLKHGI